MAATKLHKHRGQVALLSGPTVHSLYYATARLSCGKRTHGGLMSVLYTIVYKPVGMQNAVQMPGLGLLNDTYLSHISRRYFLNEVTL